jgi:hypothetical protein
METTTCPTCGADLEVIERTRVKPSWAGGGQETIRETIGCEACERRQEQRQAAIVEERRFRSGLRDSGIPEAVWGLGLDAASWRHHRLDIDDGNKPAIAALREWVEADNAGCLLMGTQGLGKTLLAMCAGVECIRRGQEVLFVTERDLFDAFRGRRTSERDITLEARSIEVLILDDIGRHQIDRGSKFMVEVYLDLFDCRLPIIGPPLKTLLTTQQDAASLAKACADDALASRLMAIVGGNHVELSGRDRRRVRWGRA